MAKTRGTQRRALQLTGNRSDSRLMEIWLTVRSVVCWILKGLYRAWKLNPVSLFRHRMRTMYRLDAQTDLPIKPKWTERIKDLFISDIQRKIRLLQWVRTQVNHVNVEDFIYSWQDGIALCALLESVCPGVCPRFYLLKSDLRVNNCRFGLQIAHQFLGIQRTILSPEEMAIADEDTELKIVHLVQMIRWKTQRMSKSTAVETRAVTMPVRRILSRCFARGAGLKTGMVGRRAKFNIFTDCNGVLDILVEIRGPNGEMNSEKITSLHTELTPDTHKDNNTLKPLSPEPRSRVISDDHGNTFRRQKSFDEDLIEVIPFDYQSVGEGRFLASYVPRNPGIHTIVIKSHDHHIQGSPFEVSVSTWTSSWNIVGKNKLMALSMLPSIDESPSRKKQLEAAVSSRFLEAASQRSRRHRGGSSKQLTVSKRRVLKRVLTRNGEEILLSDYTPSPTLSRQSSADVSDLSEEDQRKENKYSDGNVLFVNPQPTIRKDNDGKLKPLKLSVKDEIYVPRNETSCDTSDSLSPRSVDSSSTTYDTRSGQDSQIGRQSDSDLSSRSSSASCTQKQFSKTPIHKSFSESFVMDVELVKRDGSDVIDPNMALGRENDSPSLKVLQSESLKKACFYISDKPVLESVGSLNSPGNTSTETPVPVVMRPRPKLAQIQKMSRKWQSVDVTGAAGDLLPLTTNDSQVSDSSQNTSSSEWSLAKDHSEQVVSWEESGTEVSKSSNSEVPGSAAPRIEDPENSGDIRNVSGKPSSSKCISSSFRSIANRSSSPGQKWSNSHVSIVTPKVKTDKSTQVSSEEIKQETEWQPGTYSFRKRRICLNRGYVKLYGQDISIDHGNASKGEEFGNISTENNNWIAFSDHSVVQNQDDRVEQSQGGRDQCNVRDWLLNIGRGRFNLSADRQSTIDTNDSGIADETMSVMGNKHRRISRRSYTWEIPLDPEKGGNNRQHDAHSRNYLYATLDDQWVELTSCDVVADGLSLSDSELEYGQRTLFSTHRFRRKSRNRWVHGILENSKLVDKQVEEQNVQTRKMVSKSQTGSSQPPEVNIKTSGKKSQPSKHHVSFSTDLCDDAESFNMTKHKERRSRSLRSSLTSQNAVDQTLESDSPTHDTLTQDICRVNSPECLQVGNGAAADNGIPDDETATDVSPLLLNNLADTDVSSTPMGTSKAPLSQPDTSADNSFDTPQTATDNTSIDDLYDAYCTSSPIKVLEDLFKNNLFVETDERRDRLPGDTEEGEDCLVFGSGLSYGHVGITNNFQVWVRHPTNGSVSVSIYGPKPHCVTETTTTYTGDSLYEVMYVVTQPGNYVISVKWCDQNLPNSPFIAKIAWDD